jgi:putative ABC transport system ATP-binding protein
MTEDAMTPVIELTGIEKIYDTGSVRVHALRNVSLEIQPGEFVAIMGTSGSGKSTLMNILGCLDRPTAGRYLMEGVDISQLDKDQRADVRNRKLGFVFQALRRTTAACRHCAGAGEQPLDAPGR